MNFIRNNLLKSQLQNYKLNKILIAGKINFYKISEIKVQTYKIDQEVQTLVEIYKKKDFKQIHRL
mgnify:CR=1 FL=1|jgi:hypothetical protein